VLTVVVLSGVAGAFTSCAPTGNPGVDHVLTGLLAAATAWAASTASPVALSIGALTVLVAGDSMPLRLLGAALVVALAVLFNRDRLTPLAGAVVGAAVVQALLRLPWTSPVRASAVAAAIGIVPILFSGAWRATTGRPQLRKRVVAGIVVAGAIVGIGGIYIALRTDEILDGAQRFARAGVAAARDGNQKQAAAYFEDAGVEFRRAHHFAGSWWARPGRVIPVVAPQLRALDGVSAIGAEAVDAAHDTVARVDPYRLRFVNGRINLAEVARDQQVFAAASRKTDDIAARLHAESQVWLAPPIQHAIARFSTVVVSAGDSAHTAADALALAPSFLGADGPKTYFIAFVTPVEARGSGGLIANYGILRARNGRVHLETVGSAPDLNRVGATTKHLNGLAEYQARYDRFDVANTWQNVSMSPDFPTVAQAIAQLYPQSGGERIDGVIEVGPAAMAGLLALTGPVRVPGLATTIDQYNASPFLLHDQYKNVTDDRRRYDRLSSLARVTFDKLTSGTSATPTVISQTMSPIVRRQQLAFWLRDPTGQRFIERIGGDASVALVDGSDSFGVIDQNGNGSKIDYYLHRTIHYTAHVDGRSGQVDAHVTITLRNDSPHVSEAGMPWWYIGSPFKEYNGTNRTIASFYSPLALAHATLDGKPLTLAGEREFGRNVWTRFIDIGPHSSRTIVLDLSGSVDLSSGHYLFDYLPQQLPNIDSVYLQVDVSHAHTTGVEAKGFPVAVVRRTPHSVSAGVGEIGPWSVDVGLKR